MGSQDRMAEPAVSLLHNRLPGRVHPTKDMWSHLKGHLNNLVTHLIFPILCLSEEDLREVRGRAGRVSPPQT